MTRLREVKIEAVNAAKRPTKFRLIDSGGRDFIVPADEFRAACNHNVAGLPPVSDESRIRSGDVPAAGANGHHQLDFVVQVLGLRRVGHGAGGAVGHVDDGVCRFHEEERRLAAGEAHLLGVFGVVAADTVDAAHGKLSATKNCHGGGHGRRNHEGHCVVSKDKGDEIGLAAISGR